MGVEEDWKTADAWLSSRAASSNSSATSPKKMDGRKRKTSVASKVVRRAGRRVTTGSLLLAACSAGGAGLMARRVQPGVRAEPKYVRSRSTCGMGRRDAMRSGATQSDAIAKGWYGGWNGEEMRAGGREEMKGEKMNMGRVI